jgi:hypothetical protein
MPLYTQTPVSDQYQLLGFKDAHGTVHGTPITRWAKHDGPALLNLAEVDASHSNAVLCLNAMLENNLACFPDGEFEIPDDKYVIADANTDMSGATADHNGRFKHDLAFADRFVMQIEWRHDDKTEEIIAGIKSGLGGEDLNRVLLVSRMVRKLIKDNGIEFFWGARRTFAVAQLYAAGLAAKEAVLAAGLGRLDEGQRDRVLSNVDWS